MEHEKYLEWMSEDLDGQLSPAHCAQLKQHLQHCPSCAQRYVELSQQSKALQGLDCPLPPHLHQDILEHLPPQVSIRRPKKAWKVWAPLAACLALVVTLGYAALHQPGDNTPAVSARSNPGLAPAVFSVQPQKIDVPGGDTVLLLFQPLSQAGSELLNGLPTTALEGGYVCCVTDADTAQSLAELLTQSGQEYSQCSAAAPDGSGNIAIVWPVG